MLAKLIYKYKSQRALQRPEHLWPFGGHKTDGEAVNHKYYFSFVSTSAKLNSELFVYFEIQILGKAITIKYLLDTILI